MEIAIITGKVNSGKTTLLEKIAAREKLNGNFPTGIIARGVFRNGKKIGFDVMDLATGKIQQLARINNKKDKSWGSRFTFYHAGWKFARNALLNFRPGGVVFLDEVGPLELKGEGHARTLKKLLQSNIGKIYISVRSDCLKEVRKKFFPSGKYIRILKTTGKNYETPD